MPSLLSSLSKDFAKDWKSSTSWWRCNLPFKAPFLLEGAFIGLPATCVGEPLFFCAHPDAEGFTQA